MNDEELRHYKALQPVFREKMGEWQAGDWGYHVVINGIFWVAYPEGELLMVYWKGHESPKDVFRSNAIYLPLPIDPVNPERGCWGMIDWQIFWCEPTRDGKLRMFKRVNTTGIADWIDSPALALLRALAHQYEGVGEGGCLRTCRGECFPILGKLDVDNPSNPINKRTLP